MAADDLAAALAGIATWQLMVKVVLVCLAAQTAKFLYQGVRIRLKFRRMQYQGIVIPAGHSLLLGHLPLLKGISGAFPKDVSSNYCNRELILNWRRYFPGATACPPVIYLDVWPIYSEPMAMINDPGLCHAVTAERFPPRHELRKFFGRAVGGKTQLLEWDGAQHRLWRSRMNPGFSIRNLQAHIAGGRMVDEVCIFAERLKKSCGSDGGWGEVFQMFPMAVDLTFDVICGAVLDFSPGEQSNGPTELQSAMRTISAEYLIVPSLENLHTRLNPLWNLRYYQCQRTMRRALLPHIQKSLPSQSESEPQKSSKPKTVISFAMKVIEGESTSGNREPTKDFIENVLGLAKVFIFAGHDTTAIALSFAFHCLQKSPQVLQKLRAEHDAVFGADVSAAPNLLRESPHLLASLPYTTAVLKETLRLFPVVGGMRRSDARFVLRDPVTAKAWPTDGFILAVGVATLQCHPDIWPRPTEFLPERWMAGEGDPLYSGASSKYAWRPFDLGPMNCIGMELALMELKMALLFTVREVEFETALDEWDRLQGKDPKDRPTIDGDPLYQTGVGLGPPVEKMPMRVRLLSRV